MPCLSTLPTAPPHAIPSPPQVTARPRGVQLKLPLDQALAHHRAKVAVCARPPRLELAACLVWPCAAHFTAPCHVLLLCLACGMVACVMFACCRYCLACCHWLWCCCRCSRVLLPQLTLLYQVVPSAPRLSSEPRRSCSDKRINL
jgi:hypothetical protein